MLRWFLADLRTGRHVADIRPATGRWERFLNAPETLSCSLDMHDPDTVALQQRVAAAPGRTVLVVAEGDVVLAAGPIWAHDYSRDSGTLDLSAKGLWSYYGHRFVLPVEAATVAVTEFVIPDPSAEGATMPNPDVGTYLSGWELGTIAKKIVEQAHDWDGGEVPVVFEADRIGAHERNFEGSEFKNVRTVLGQLTEVEGGPDITFQPRLTTDRLGIEWVLRTGTEAEPQLSGSSVHRWDLTVPQSGVSKLSITQDASDIAGAAWATGGRSGDSVLVARSIDTTLTDLGYPLFELLDSSHSSVDVQGTLDAYAAESTTFGRGPVEEWSFTVEANQQPRLGEFWEGDYCDVDLAAYDPDTGTGDPYLFEGGTFRHRIVGISGDAVGLNVNVTCAPVRST